MAGVLFIIWIPCERYEEALAGDKQVWEKTTPIKGRHVVPNSNSSDEKVRKKVECGDFVKEDLFLQESSLETFAVSIESDSLNQDDHPRDDKKKELKRTKSAGDVAEETKPNDNSLEDPRLMDSDEYLRLQKMQECLKENEEAVDKFFGTDLQSSPLDEMSSMEKVIRDIIDRFRIKNSSWVRVNNGNTFQITFSLENGVRCDDTIHMLSEFGIGQKNGSSVAIVPCTLYSEQRRSKDEDMETASGLSNIKETAWNKFVGTVRARMNVAKTVEAVRADATLTFDFIVILIVASIIASFGLVENSTLFLAASMLISPLMGPILAATFGAVIKDHKLQYWGLANEFIGIFMCIAVGFLFGLITCGLDYSFGSNKEITHEMKMRTDLHSVIVGIFIALPSGAAVAIAVLGNNFGSLVGVAISASLLPPAVNTGLFWSFSLVHLIFKDIDPRFKNFVKEKVYTEDEALELLTLGSISLLVTLTNVLCIYVMGCIFLKVKEVAPVSPDQRQFWQHDIKIARDYNKTIHADEGEKMREELAQFHEDEFRGVGAELLRLSHYPHTNTWSPLTLRNHRKEVHNTRNSLHDFDGLCSSLSGKNVNAFDRSHRHCQFTKSLSPPASGKATLPIFTAPRPLHDHQTFSSAPLQVITEMTKLQQETLVSIEGRASTSGNPRKFIVTPARDPLI